MWLPKDSVLSSADLGVGTRDKKMKLLPAYWLVAPTCLVDVVESQLLRATGARSWFARAR